MYNYNSWNQADYISSNAWSTLGGFYLCHFLERICNIIYKTHYNATELSIYVQCYIWNVAWFWEVGMNIAFHTSIFLLCDFRRQHHPQLVAAHHSLNTNLVVQLLIATEQKLHVIFEPNHSPTGRILYSLFHQIIQVHIYAMMSI